MLTLLLEVSMKNEVCKSPDPGYYTHMVADAYRDADEDAGSFGASALRSGLNAGHHVHIICMFDDASWAPDIPHLYLMPKKG